MCPKRGAASHEDTDVGMFKLCISAAVSPAQRASCVGSNLVPGARRLWGKGGLRVSASGCRGLRLWGLHGAVFGWLGLSLGLERELDPCAGRSAHPMSRSGEDMDRNRDDSAVGTVRQPGSLVRLSSSLADWAGRYKLDPITQGWLTERDSRRRESCRWHGLVTQS
jgi:hypothetical protein